MYSQFWLAGGILTAALWRQKERDELDLEAWADLPERERWAHEQETYAELGIKPLALGVEAHRKLRGKKAA